ncbi:hypothetical protein SO694_00123056 [Aureococcus anophagefferens]|uniref:Uncharacterized protein n=1 Tax=Aureococcus anophagefferens TaxID=44056 RepID=A0ABR1FIW5_AURAN
MGKKRRASSADPTRAAMGLYERSLSALDGGDEAAALALLDGAARALALAPGGDVASGLGAEVELRARGRLLGGARRGAAAAAYEASHGADGNAPAAVLAARLAWLEDAPDVERLLGRASPPPPGDGGGGAATRLRAPLPLPPRARRRTRRRGVDLGCVDVLGYAATFSPRALRVWGGLLPRRRDARPVRVRRRQGDSTSLQGSRARVCSRAARPKISRAENDRDRSLSGRRFSCADGAAYYAENDYGSPSVGL